MSHYIVLVKQVPDVSQITDNAFDPETGNLIRTRLPSVMNEHDAQALAFAHQMRMLSGDTQAQLVCLSMGPPMAEEVLRYSLARCADDVVLLTDRALGGADTVATANPLAYGVRKIVAEKFGGSNDYYIIAGMQSVDGDTAQVPAQLAEELKLPCIAYATEAEYDDGKFRFTRIISGGSQVVQTKKLPVVVTVAKYEFPVYPTFGRTRRANKTRISQWTASDINAEYIGVKGSKTRVIRVFPPGKTTRKCREVKDVKELARLLIEAASAEVKAQETEAEKKKHYLLPKDRPDKFDRSFEGLEKEAQDYVLLMDIFREMGIHDLSQIDEAKKEQIVEKAGGAFRVKALEDMLEGFKAETPSYTGEVWVCAEHDGIMPNSATFELLGKARDLADSLNVDCGVVIAGEKVQPMTKDLIAAGADKVYAIEHPLLGEFDPTAYRKAIATTIERHKPQIVLYGATPQGRVLAPMVSYRVQCGLTADCTGLAINDSSRKGQIACLFQTRPALGGNVMATISTKDSDIQMATARPGVMQALSKDYSRKGKVINELVELTEEDVSLRIIKTEMGSGEVNFDAEVIISGGKGLQDRTNFETKINSLMNAIAGKTGATVELGASRTAVEQGFAERIHQ
ncbi:MAG: FAD-binding protein, partial [Sedimentisphaerales bacterium]|nr:FAD-binding protein [Sedimentisphaerales bacterium]